MFSSEFKKLEKYTADEEAPQMSKLKPFSYPDISRRWMVLASLSLIIFNLAIYISDIIISFSQYMPYSPVSRVILFITLFSFLAGNGSGRFLYTIFSRYRIINTILSLALFIITVLFYFKVIIWGGNFSLFNIYSKSRYLSSLILIIPLFLSGIINCYFLKVCSGDFIDEKNLLFKYVSVLFISISVGIAFSLLKNILSHDYSSLKFILSIVAIIPVILSIFTRIPFNPELLVAQHYADDEHSTQEIFFRRDDLLYTYLNFSYIAIYLFLGLIAFNRFFGSFYYFNLAYIAVILSAIVIGIILGGTQKLSSWHIYSEMLFPVFFLSYLFLLFNHEGRIQPAAGYAFLVIPSCIFGFSIRQTIANITFSYDHERRFRIMNISLFILPIPILLAASLIKYSNLFFFIILYIITLLNIIIPGLFLFNSKLGSIKKLFYFIISLLFIPAIIFTHLYYKISLNSRPFIDNIANFELLRNTNYNLPYISERGEIKKSGSTIFFLSDSTIKNLKRAVASTTLFTAEDSNVLVIDSNQNFFKNPLYGVYKNAVIFNDIPADYICDNKLPVSGRDLYVAQSIEPVNYLIKSRDRYFSIIDSPNILDQNFHYFRFSNEYKNLIKKHLTDDGIYFQIIDLQFSNYNLILTSLEADSKHFKNHLIMIFSNIAVIISSDSIESLKLTTDSISRITGIIDKGSIFGLIFYNKTHPVNNIIFNDINVFKQFLTTHKEPTLKYYNPVEIKQLPEQLTEFYFSYERDWLNSVLSRDSGKDSTMSNFRSLLTKDRQIHDLIKKSEYAESINAYDQETDILFQLKKIASYNSDLKNYLSYIMEFKDKYYYSEAIRLEKEKKWDDAAILYRAILTMNSDNFDANYRFGLLYITLQDIDNAFKYLDTALKLNKNHPQVLYQMGILQFSSDKFKESIDYLEKAKALGINTPTLYMYLGISYEKIKQYDKAKENLEQAAALEPGDVKLKTLIEQINDKIIIESNQNTGEEKSNMSDDEQDVEIKIPINKKARNARLQDDE